MLRCNGTPSILDEEPDEEILDEASDPMIILMRLEEQAEREAKRDQIEEKQGRDRERIDKVLIPGDFPVGGLSAMARKIARSPQWLWYCLQKGYPELAFVQRNYDGHEAMASSLQNFRDNIIPLVETRGRQERQDRGRARGKANKRSQIWHGLPCKPPGDE
jgi:hypothetical protein